MDGTSFGCLSVIVIFVVLAVMTAIGNEKARANAKVACHNSLSKLAKDPTNAALRKTTLNPGRSYSNLTRNSKGVTVYDEVALTNDINAACAGATSIRHAAAPPPVAASVRERLIKLDELRSQELITDLEYETKRKQLLDEL